jgi:hypothetical protein
MGGSSSGGIRHSSGSDFLPMIKYLILAALLWATPIDAARFYPVPECPYTGHATCSDGKDNDGDGTKDEAAPSAAFSAVTGGYAADVAECQLLGYASTVDAESDSGNMASKSTTYRSGQAGCTGSFTAGTYFVWIKARIAAGTDADKRLVWSSSSPFTSRFTRTNAGLPFVATEGISSVMAFTKLGAGVTVEQIGVTGQPNDTAHQSFALDGNGTIYLVADAAVKLDCIFLSTDPDATPTCPSGSQLPAAPQPGAITVSSVTTTGFTATWDWDTQSADDGDCFLRYGTTSGNLDQVSATATSTSGNCVRQITGLTSGTIYFMRGTSENGTGANETPEAIAQTQVQVTGPIRFAIPSGGSTSANCLSAGTPCTLARALNQAVAGDTVQLGCSATVYPSTSAATVRSGTVTQPITIKAETRRCATVQFTPTVTNTDRIFNITHSNIIVSGIIFDGNTWSFDGVRVTCTAASPCTNIIFEDNQVTNTGGKGLGVHHHIDGFVARWNDFDNLGKRYGNGGGRFFNEAFYFGTATSLDGANDWVQNFQIYANTVDGVGAAGTGENLFDLKFNVRDGHIHHNIFKNLTSGNDGCVVLTATGYLFEDNILRDSTCGLSADIDYLRPNGDNILQRNVFYNLTGASTEFIWYGTSAGLTATQVINNTFCGLSNYNIVARNTSSPAGAPSGMTVSGNSGLPGGVASSVCDAEVARIMAEMQGLPGNPTPQEPGDPGDGPIAYWTFDENTGTVAADSVGSNDATLLNGATWATGKNGSGASLDGTDDYVKALTTSMSATEGTITMWVKPSAFGTANAPDYIVGHTSQPAFGNRIQLSTNNAAGELDLGLGDTGSRAANIFDMDAATWYHLALTWASGTYVVYVNGVQDTTGSYTGLTTLGAYLHLGNHGNDGTTIRPFAGVIDEVKIWNRALTAPQVDAEFDIFGP